MGKKITSDSFAIIGGSPNHFLKADGSVDTGQYMAANSEVSATDNTKLALAGGTLTGNLTISSGKVLYYNLPDNTAGGQADFRVGNWLHQYTKTYATNAATRWGEQWWDGGSYHSAWASTAGFNFGSALNGTSATFSSSVTAGGTLGSYNISGGIGRLQIRGSQAGARSYEISNAIDGISNSGFQILDETAATKLLYFGASGAATFASSVTATDGIFSGNVGIGTTNPTRKLSVQSQYAEMVLKSTALSGAVGGSTLYFGNATSDSEAWINHDNGTKELSFRVNSINALQLNSTAAATFASSVSANGNIDTTKANPVVEAISTGASTNRTRLAVATTVGAFVGTSQVGDSVISATSNLIISTNNTQRLYVAASGTVAIENELIVTGSISAGGAVRVGNSTSLASASTVGQIRYRTSGTNSYMDMAMQIGASTYAWVNIVENNWA